jgi:hypothetical protein
MSVSRRPTLWRGGHAAMMLFVALCVACSGRIPDVGRTSPEEFVASMYALISGPAGERDWDAIRELFVPGAGMLSLQHTKSDSIGTRMLELDAWIEGSRRYLAEHAVYERQTGARTQDVGHLVHVFSRYESRESPDGELSQAGINSVLLVRHGDAWKIVALINVERE